MMKQSNCRKKRMLLMRFFLTSILFFGGYVYSTAQNQKTQVTGVITSKSDNLSLPGVSVIDVDEPKNGVNADFDGRYSINLKNGNATLRFTMIGYKPVEVKVNNRTSINVSMDLDVSNLIINSSKLLGAVY